MTVLYDPHDDWATEASEPAPTLDLFVLATRIRDGKSLTSAERAEVSALLTRVHSARKIWDRFAQDYPDDDPTMRAHHMRGVLAYVINRDR